MGKIKTADDPIQRCDLWTDSFSGRIWCIYPLKKLNFCLIERSPPSTLAKLSGRLLLKALALKYVRSAASYFSFFSAHIRFVGLVAHEPESGNFKKT